MNSILFTIMFLFILQPSYSQSDNTFIEGAPDIFLDCQWQCDFDAFRNNVKYVNFVRDRQSADVHVLVTSQSVGSGGEKYTLYFTGLNNYQSIMDTLYHVSGNDDSDKIINDGLMVTFKKGILAYLLNSPVKDRISYNVEDLEFVESTKGKLDPWNSWVFSIRTSGFFSGESNYNNYSLRGNIRADRVTKESKAKIALGSNYRASNFYFRNSLNEIIDTLTIRSIRRNKFFNTSYIHSVSDHFSLGVFYNLFENNNYNYKLATRVRVGAEYNFYKYNESDRRQFTIVYKIGLVYNDYIEETVNDQFEELVFTESINLSLFQKQDWGTISASVGFDHYFHDIKLNRLNLNTDLDWNITKGLTIGLGAYVSFVNDQINLPKSQVVIEDRLLRNRLLATNYSLFGNINIRYTFGSKYNNIVNSRFSEGYNF